jgi:protein-tyrosine sulfotransferase
MTPAINAAPFFVVGIARSGTTLLRVMLDAHPDISMGPETNVLHHWFNGADSSSLDRWTEAADGYDGLILEMFERIHVDYMNERGKRRWGDKTPQYWKLIPRILETWPQAQFVYCIRDGRDVVCSMRDRWGWRVHYTSRLWSDGVNEALDIVQQHPDNVHVVHYEDLVTEPADAVAGVLEFLREPWDDAVLEPGRASHDDFESDSSAATQPVFTSSIGRWREDLGPIDSRVATHFMKDSLRRAGYTD